MKQKTIGIILLTVGIGLVVSGIFTIIVDCNSPKSSDSTVSAWAAESEPVQMMKETTKTPANVQNNVLKGQVFEEYVISKFDFSRKSLTLLSHADNSTSATKPDLDIKLKAGGKDYRFAAECVWRQNMPHESLDWCKEEKIEILKNYQKKNNAMVFIVVGIGGNPRKPEQLFIVPFNERPYASIYTSMLRKYKVKTMEGKFFYETSTNTLTIK